MLAEEGKFLRHWDAPHGRLRVALHLGVDLLLPVEQPGLAKIVAEIRVHVVRRNLHARRPHLWVFCPQFVFAFYVFPVVPLFEGFLHVRVFVDRSGVSLCFVVVPLPRGVVPFADPLVVGFLARVPLDAVRPQHVHVLVQEGVFRHGVPHFVDLLLVVELPLLPSDLLRVDPENGAELLEAQLPIPILVQQIQQRRAPLVGKLLVAVLGGVAVLSQPNLELLHRHRVRLVRIEESVKLEPPSGVRHTVTAAKHLAVLVREPCAEVEEFVLDRREIEALHGVHLLPLVVGDPVHRLLARIRRHHCHGHAARPLLRRIQPTRRTRAIHLCVLRQVGSGFFGAGGNVHLAEEGGGGRPEPAPDGRVLVDLHVLQKIVQLLRHPLEFLPFWRFAREQVRGGHALPPRFGVDDRALLAPQPIERLLGPQRGHRDRAQSTTIYQNE
mmetsp:Transcript_14366/g.35831  ORF Transcript_14366/g.35831 Transcript_14366/m.35831 type:complete len:440 (-) Transcript_14366:69-1388(-)